MSDAGEALADTGETTPRSSRSEAIRVLLADLWPGGPLARTGVGFAIAAVAAAGEFAISSRIGAVGPYGLLTIAVGGVGIYGGALAGAAAGGLGLAFAAIWYRLHPTGADAAAYQTALFACVAAAACWVGERRRASVGESDRAAARLAAEQSYVQSVLDTVPDAMIVIDEAGAITSFSRAAERMFGYAADEALGRNVSMLMPSPYHGNHDTYIQRYRRTGEPRIIGIGRMIVGRRKDGATFPMELAVGEMRSRAGRHFIGFVRDLTERQETEKRLQDIQEELIHVSRLTALGEMSSALAHELNQPLSAISNYLNGAQRLLAQDQSPGTEKVRSALERAAAQALRSGDIIRRLREFVARGETDHRVESAARLVEEACALALVGARQIGLRVVLNLDCPTDAVMVDKVQIQQVLLNLIRNGIEAMSGSETRELTITVAPWEGDMVRISVADTGSGIDPAVAERLFQPFLTTKAEGMGVGLSICRTIVEAHGGRIWTEPNAGGGTVFHFTAPLADADARGLSDVKAADRDPG